jgi:peroxiredoxin
MFMKKRLFAVVLPLIVSVAVSAAAGPGADVGDIAPAFRLADAKEHEVSLKDFKGEIVVLEWVNPDCPFVKRHYKEGTMKELVSAYGDRGVVWLTINSTNYMDRAVNASFAEAEGIEWPILVDQDGTVGHAYGAATTPHMFVIDTSGKIVYEGAIDDDPRGDKEAEARVNYVADALDELLAGKVVSTPETKPYGCSVKYKK